VPLIEGCASPQFESAFEIKSIKKRDVTMLHAMWLGEITIRHRQSVLSLGDTLSLFLSVH
jgi:hypothetical protein